MNIELTLSWEAHVIKGLRKGSKRGFSLVELMVVLVIAGVLLMMSIGIADSVIRRSEFSGAITSLVADITQAKQIAARDNRYVAVIFNTDNRSYTLRVQENITSTTSWRDLRTVRALDGKVFFDSSSSTVKNFAVSSTGEVREYPLNLSAPPTQISLAFFIRKNEVDGSPRVYERTVRIFPYGGIKVEK